MNLEVKTKNYNGKDIYIGTDREYFEMLFECHKVIIYFWVDTDFLFRSPFTIKIY